MTAPPPGRLRGRRIGGVRHAGRPHPPAPSRVPPSSFTPVRLPLPPDLPPRELARIWQVTTVIFDVDDSGSMYGRHADDRGVRYAAARSVVDLMVRAGGGRAGVVHFGSTAPAELALAPVDVRRRRRALDAALRIPPSLGGTDLASGLDRSRLLLEAPRTDEQQAVLVLTDGLQDTGLALRAAVERLPASSVHVLLIDHLHTCGAGLEASWRALPLGSFTRLPLDDPAQLSWLVADVLVRSRGLTLPPLSAPTLRRYLR